MVASYWDAYSDKLFHFLVKRTGDREVARDLLQDTFHKALLHEQHLSREVDNPESWLMSVARNTLIDHTRKKREGRMDDPKRIPDRDADYETDGLVEGISECLYELINEYEPEERELLEKVFTKSMTQKEMARYMDLPYSTLKSRVQKAREEIMEAFRSRCCTLRRNASGEIIGCIPVGTSTLADC